MKKLLSSLVCAAFVLNSVVQPAYAQALLGKLGMPEPGAMVGLSQSYNPPVLRGIKVFTNAPLKFDFILDPGDQAKKIMANGKVNAKVEAELKEVSNRLIKYFLTTVTVPDNDIWVNLSPYEKGRITAEKFGQTEMGRDLLSQDYLLKQITASLMYPDGEVGRKFWARVYEEAQKKFGTTQIPTDTLNKVWIMPEKAVLYEKVDGDGQRGATAFVVESRLKVMLESDYVAQQGVKAEAVGALVQDATATQELAKAVAREVIVPLLQKEVNEGENFAPLRQVYNSIILALWYKEKVKGSIMSAYIDHNKVAGVDIADKKAAEKIWQQYVEAFKKGAVNLIKEEKDAVTGEMMPRQYFAGGFSVENAQSVTKYITALPKALVLTGFLLVSAGCGGGGSGGASNVVVTPPVTDYSGPVVQALQDIESQERANYTKYTSTANVETNMQVSYEGAASDASDVIKSGVATYDLGLKARAALLGFGAQSGAEKIVSTYAKNNHNNPTETAPITFNLLTGGVNNILKIADFSVTNWWDNWEWTTIVGPNAWIADASIQLYQRTSDQKYFDFAIERAAFIFRMMDVDGSVRMGPEDGAFGWIYWNKKSTENALSSYQFLNDLVAVLNAKGVTTVTLNSQVYTLDDLRARADKMYAWMKTMFDQGSGVFHRGQEFNTASGQWVTDTLDGVNGKFATDTTSWAPIEKMLGDTFFGATVNDRIDLVDRMFQQTEALSGVLTADGYVRGFDFSKVRTVSDRVIWVEGSAQMPYLLFAIKCSENGRMELAEKYFLRHMGLIYSLKGYRQQLADGRQGLPYAASRAGQVAVVDTGHDWTTPNAQVSMSSTIYYATLAAAIDPLRGKDLKADREALVKKLLTSSSAASINTKLERIKSAFAAAPVDQAMGEQMNGGIDLKANVMSMQVQGLGDGLKFNIDPVMLKDLERLPGLTPFVIRVAPMNDVRSFLEFK